MSFSSNGVTFNRTKWIRNRIFRFFFRGAEGVLSVLLAISMAGPMIFPQEASAALGVSSKLSYQGRLTNATGDPYTGTYYVCFSIFDASTAGTKVWPTGVPTSNTVTVTNGVFDVGIGVANALDFDFSSNDTVYLNVGVSASNVACDNVAMENLTPRQRMDATPYARVAENVYGTALRTSALKVGIGAGTGQATPIWLNLDWKNTGTTLGAACPSGSVNGSVWYNSSGTRSLACVNNVVVGMDNTNEITNLNITGNTAGTPTAISTGAVSFAGGNNITLSQAGNAITISGQPAHGIVIASALGGGTAGVTASVSSGYLTLAGGNNITLSQNGNAITISAGAGGGGGVAIGAGASTATNGTIIFSNANGVSFGLNNGTMTASAAGGGGASPSIRFVEGNIRQSISNITNITALTGRPIFIPFSVGGNLTASRIMLEMSRATSGSNLFSVHAGFYSFVNATQLSLIGSWSNSYSNSATVSVSGIRQFHITGVPVGASTLSAGNYILGLEFTAAATASMNYSIRGGITAGPPLGQIAPGANSYSTATSHGMFPFFGRYSTTVAALPNSIGASQVIAGFSGASTPVGAWFGIRAD